MNDPFGDESYFPSAKLAIVIRFDEFGDGKVAAKGRTANPKSPLKAKGIKGSAAPLTPGNDPDAPAGVKRILLKPATGVKGGPQKQAASADEYTQALAGIIPRTANWGLNGARTADTLSIALRWIDLPIDPRTVRSCAVEFYLGCVTVEEFARGIRGEKRGEFSGPGETLNMVPDTYLDDNGDQRSNRRFEGWVDTWSVEWDDGEPMVRLECRDNTSLLIDRECPQKLVLDMSKPIDQAIATYLSNFSQYGGLTVEYRPAGEPVPILKNVLSKTAYHPNLGPQPSKAGGAASGGASTAQKLSVWDYLTDVCASIGHMIRLEDTNLIIQRARSYIAEGFGRPDDPFQSRVLPGGERVYARRMIWGRNVLSMKMARSFAKAAPLNIEVRCYVPGRKNVIVARFPSKTDAVEDAKPGDGTPDEKWTVYRVSGVKDQATLEHVAQGIYEQLVRNELSVQIKTHSLASFGGDNADPDLLDLKAGDSLEVLVNRDDVEVNTMTHIETLLLMQERAETFMRQLGYDGKFASAYAKAYTNSGFQTVFRVKSLAVSWDAEDGVSLDVQAINYLEVRMDNVLPSGEPSPGKKKKK